jgi:hypothetical protein
MLINSRQARVVVVFTDKIKNANLNDAEAQIVGGVANVSGTKQLYKCTWTTVSYLISYP